MAFLCFLTWNLIKKKCLVSIALDYNYIHIIKSGTCELRVGSVGNVNFLRLFSDKSVSRSADLVNLLEVYGCCIFRQRRSSMSSTGSADSPAAKKVKKKLKLYFIFIWLVNIGWPVNKLTKRYLLRRQSVLNFCEPFDRRGLL